MTSRTSAFREIPMLSNPATLRTLEDILVIKLKKIPQTVRREVAGHSDTYEFDFVDDASALAEAVAGAESSKVEEALAEADRAYTEALEQVGVPAKVLDLFRGWMELHSNTRAVQRQIEVARAFEGITSLSPEPPHAFRDGDPMQPLTAAELGAALGGLTDESVRQREKAGQLFSVLHPARKRGREYPAFQAWPNVAGEPLTRVLAVLGPLGGTAFRAYFRAPIPELLMLTPVEVMTGQTLNMRDVGRDAESLLTAPPEERLDAVLQAAGAFAADATA